MSVESYNKLGLSKYNIQGLLSFCLLFSADLYTSVAPEINERSSMWSRDKEANLYLLSLHYVLLDSVKRTSVTFNAAEPAYKSGACKSPESITIKRCKKSTVILLSGDPFFVCMYRSS